MPPQPCASVSGPLTSRSGTLSTRHNVNNVDVSVHAAQSDEHIIAIHIAARQPAHARTQAASAYVLKNGTRVIGGTVGVATAMISDSPPASTEAITRPSVPVALLPPVQTAAPLAALRTHWPPLTARSGGTAAAADADGGDGDAALAS